MTQKSEKQYIYTDNTYKLRWCQHCGIPNILIVDVIGQWTWRDAHNLINHVNAELAVVDGRCYSIFHLTESSQKALENSFAFAHLEELIRSDPLKEELVYFVGKVKTLRNAIFIVERVQKLFNRTSKFKYTDTVLDALEEIEDYEAQLNRAAAAD